MLRDKLAKLREEILKEPGKGSDEIDKMEAAARRAIVVSELQNTDGFKILIGLLHKRIEKISILLQNDEKLTDSERMKLFERRKSYRWFLNIFVVSDKTIENVEKRIDELLSNLE
jgi:hypothetical protein